MTQTLRPGVPDYREHRPTQAATAWPGRYLAAQWGIAAAAAILVTQATSLVHLGAVGAMALGAAALTALSRYETVWPAGAAVPVGVELLAIGVLIVFSPSGAAAFAPLLVAQVAIGGALAGRAMWTLFAGLAIATLLLGLARGGSLGADARFVVSFTALIALTGVLVPSHDGRGGRRAQADLEHSARERATRFGRALERLRDGDLSPDLSVGLYEPGAPMEELFATVDGFFGEAVQNLRDLVLDIQARTNSLETSADSLRAMAADQAGISAEQSAATLETSAAIEELAAASAKIDETSTEVAKLAKRTTEAAESGRQAVGSSSAAIEKISGKVGTITVRAERLGGLSKEITSILDLIDEVAAQTNLLSLNAAIEAARAGEQGRGFAVVADEVRKLAEKASSATGDIHELISEVQAEVARTIAAARESAEEVESGTRLATRATGMLEEITSHAGDAAVAAAEISTAASQQRLAGDQSVEAVSLIASAGQNGLETSMRTAVEADALAGLAAELQAAVSHFKLESRTAVSRPASRIGPAGGGPAGGAIARIHRRQEVRT